MELDSMVECRRRRGISEVGKAIRDRFGEESEVEEWGEWEWKWELGGGTTCKWVLLGWFA